MEGNLIAPVAMSPSSLFTRPRLGDYVKESWKNGIFIKQREMKSLSSG